MGSFLEQYVDVYFNDFYCFFVNVYTLFMWQCFGAVCVFCVCVVLFRCSVGAVLVQCCAVLVVVQFQAFGALLVHFWCTGCAVVVQLCCSFCAVSSLWCTFGAGLVQV